MGTYLGSLKPFKDAAIVPRYATDIGDPNKI